MHVIESFTCNSILQMNKKTELLMGRFAIKKKEITLYACKIAFIRVNESCAKDLKLKQRIYIYEITRIVNISSMRTIPR